MIRSWLVLCAAVMWFFSVVARGDARVASGLAATRSILWSWMFLVMGAMLVLAAVIA